MVGPGQAPRRGILGRGVRGIAHAVAVVAGSILLTLLFFMTPILYTLEVLEGHPWVYRLVAYNPLTPFTSAYQQAVFFGSWPAPALWLHMVAVSAAVWGLGAWIFFPAVSIWFGSSSSANPRTSSRLE